MADYNSKTVCRHRSHNVRVLLWLIFMCLYLFSGCNGNKWKYQPFSTGVIQIEFLNDPPSTYYISGEKGRIMYYFENYGDAIKADTAGVYHLNFDVDMPYEITTYLGEKVYQIFVFPSDTSFVRLNFAGDGYNLEFDGSARNINNYLANKTIKHRSLNIVKQCQMLDYQNYEFDEYVFKIDSLIDAELDHLNDGKSIYNLSKDFINYEKSRICYYGLNKKLERGVRRGKYDKRGRFIRSDEPIPKLYYEMIHDPSLNNSRAIFAESYFDYISTYVLHVTFEQADSKTYSKITYTDRKVKEMEKAYELLKGKSRNIYLNRQFYDLANRGWIHHSTIDSLAKVYQISGLENVYKSKKKQRSELLRNGDKLKEFYMSNPDYELHSIRWYQDINLVVRLCNQEPDNELVSNLIFEKLSADYGDLEQFEFLDIYMHVEPKEWLESRTDLEDEIHHDYIVEFGWNRELTNMFGVNGFPHFVIIGRGNILIRSQSHISLADQFLLDSLIVQDQSI